MFKTPLSTISVLRNHGGSSAGGGLWTGFNKHTTPLDRSEDYFVSWYSLLSKDLVRRSTMSIRTNDARQGGYGDSMCDLHDRHI